MMEREIANALDSIHLGREVLRLRDWLRHAPKDSELRHQLVTAFRYMNRRVREPKWRLGMPAVLQSPCRNWL